MAWRGLLLAGFDRSSGIALELQDATFVEAVVACYPALELSEVARLCSTLEATQPELAIECAEALLGEYGIRWCERVQQTLAKLVVTPFTFQDWCDEKKIAVRDLAPLLALDREAGVAFAPFLSALAALPFSKSQGAQALEWGVELFLLERPLNDLLPHDEDCSRYLKRLERWRKPQSTAHDEHWRETVTAWPWPAQVQGQWQRFGDQSGLEIKIRTTSPQDLHKKLERLHAIRDTWSCTT